MEALRVTTQDDLFAASMCRLCAHWAGDEQHVAQQVPALCRERTRLHRQPRTYADDTCPAFTDASQRGKAA